MNGEDDVNGENLYWAGGGWGVWGGHERGKVEKVQEY